MSWIKELHLLSRTTSPWLYVAADALRMTTETYDRYESVTAMKALLRSTYNWLVGESATPDGEFSSGKTMDADRVTPNGGIVEWEF